MLRDAGGGKGAGARRPPARRPAQGKRGQLGPSKPLSPAAQLLEQRVKRLSAGLGARLPDPPTLPKRHTPPLQRRRTCDNTPALLYRLGWEGGEPRPRPPAPPPPLRAPPAAELCAPQWPVQGHTAAGKQGV